MRQNSFEKLLSWEFQRRWNPGIPLDVLLEQRMKLFLPGSLA
jgi:hypothetical protein